MNAPETVAAQDGTTQGQIIRFPDKLILIVPAQAFEAARLCMGKKDVRSYLNGVRINSRRISGCNGHVLYDHKFSEDIVSTDSECVDFEGDVILLPQSRVPTKARTAVIEIHRNLAMISYFKADHVVSDPIKRDVATLLEGKYPDVDRVLGVTGEAPQSVERIGFNGGYLSLAEKISNRLHKEGITTLIMHGQNAAAHTEFRLPEEDNPHYLVVMPMRLDG